MADLSGVMEDDLRAVLRDPVFAEAWANWRRAMIPNGRPFVDVSGPVVPWIAQSAVAIAAAVGGYTGNPVYGSDVWIRLLFEEGLLA